MNIKKINKRTIILFAELSIIFTCLLGDSSISSTDNLEFISLLISTEKQEIFLAENYNLFLSCSAIFFVCFISLKDLYKKI